jgi:hypothetical protein
VGCAYRRTRRASRSRGGRRGRRKHATCSCARGSGRSCIPGEPCFHTPYRARTRHSPGSRSRGTAARAPGSRPVRHPVRANAAASHRLFGRCSPAARPMRDMGEFVSQQPSSRFGVGAVLAGSKRRRRCPMCRPERRTPARLGRQRDRCAIAPRTSRCRDCARGPARRAGSIARPGRSANGSAWPTLRALGRGDRLLPGPDRRADAAGAAGFLSVCIRTPPNPWPKRVSIDVLAPGSSERPAERRTS